MHEMMMMMKVFMIKYRMIKNEKKMTRLKNVNGRPVYEYKLSEAEEIEKTTTTTTMTRKIKLNLFEQDKIQHTKHHPIY